MKKLVKFHSVVLFVSLSVQAQSAYEGFTDYTSPLNTQGSGTSSGWFLNWSNGLATGGSQDIGKSGATVATGNL